MMAMLLGFYLTMVIIFGSRIKSRARYYFFVFNAGAGAYMIFKNVLFTVPNIARAIVGATVGLALYFLVLCIKAMIFD